MFRKIAGAWLSFFLPGFHPWNEDDRAFCAAYEASAASRRRRPPGRFAALAPRRRATPRSRSASVARQLEPEQPRRRLACRARSSSAER